MKVRKHVVTSIKCSTNVIQPNDQLFMLGSYDTHVHVDLVSRLVVCMISDVSMQISMSM